MAHENCPQCGTHKHQLVACPHCGFRRLPPTSVGKRVPEELPSPRLRQASSSPTSSNVEICPQCGARKHLIMACPECGFSRASSLLRKNEQRSKVDKPLPPDPESDKPAPNRSPVVRWKRSRTPEKSGDGSHHA